MLPCAPLLLILTAQAPAPVPLLSLDPTASDPPPPWHKRGYGMTITGGVLVGGFAPPLIGWSIALMVDARRCHAETGSAECSWSNLGAAIMLPFAVVALAAELAELPEALVQPRTAARGRLSARGARGGVLVGE